jgi:hypothetical protein
MVSAKLPYANFPSSMLDNNAKHHMFLGRESKPHWDRRGAAQKKREDFPRAIAQAKSATDTCSKMLKHV